MRFHASPVIQKLLHYIKSEKGYFDARIVPQVMSSILCVKAKQTNSRIQSQSGALLLFGHEATLPDTGSDDIGVARITVREKEHILRQLDQLNINAIADRQPARLGPAMRCRRRDCGAACGASA